MSNNKVREIVKKHLGRLMKLTITFKVNDRYRLTFLYEDEYLRIYEYKMIITCNSNEIESIKHKGRTLSREILIDRDHDFEKEIHTFMDCNL